MSGPPTIFQVFSLYRAHLREIRRLPHLYVQQFYRLKTRNDIRTMIAPSGAELLKKRFRDSRQNLRRLQKANLGDAKTFRKILNGAYGRTGKLRWELLEPLLSDPTAPLPPPIMPKVESSRPPVYPPALVKLLTDPISMSTRALKEGQWKREKLLPARADPYSEDAHLFGPLSKRREYNKLWRFHRKEMKKVLPPLEIVVNSSPEFEGERPYREDSIPFQNAGVVAEIEGLVGRSRPAPLTRKELRAMSSTMLPQGADDEGDSSVVSRPSQQHPSRWVRRRYRDLLSALPIMTYSPSMKQGKEGPFSVRLSDHAFGQTLSSSAAVREIDPTNLAWLKQAPNISKT